MVSTVQLLLCTSKPKYFLRLIIRCLGVQPPASRTGAAFGAHKPPHCRHVLLLPASLLALLGVCKCGVAELVALAAPVAGLHTTLGTFKTRITGCISAPTAPDC